jgi:RHS repeat-associated protein
MKPFKSSVYGLLVLFLLSIIVPVHAQHPDAVYPLPPNNGKAQYEGVNLFTGDVNLPVVLVSVQGRTLSYSVKAFYNSRSACINNYSTTSGYYKTVLGGYGWKLMDYPKIVQDGSDYYLVDGLSSFKLDQVSSTNNTFVYTAGSSYYLWKVSRSGSGGPDDQWLIVTAKGDSFVFEEPGVQGDITVWNVSRMVEAQWGDTLYFQYSGSGDLVSISNMLGDIYQLNYKQINGDIYLDNITHLRNDRVVEKVLLQYDSIFIYGSTCNLVSGISSLKAIAPMNLFGEAAADTAFSYDVTSLNGWAGTYATAMKWGGTQGSWQDSSDLSISSSGEVTLGGSVIKSPKYDRNRLSWSSDDGNSSSASITFKFGDYGDYFWGSQVIEKNCFTGCYQPGSGGGGPVDFRGQSNTLNYNAGALTSVTQPSGAIITFTYQQNDISDRMIVYPVVQCAVNNGYDNNSGDVIDPNTYTAIDYYFQNARWGEDQIYAQYNLVKAFPGARYTTDHTENPPYGNREFYFFNSQPASSLVDFPPDYPTQIPTEPCVQGLVYQTKSNSAASVPVEETEETSQVTYWEIGHVKDNNLGAYPRIQKKYSELYGVGNWVNYQYNEDFDLPVAESSSRENPKPGESGSQKDYTKVEFTYGFEKYPELDSDHLHILTPVVVSMEMVQYDGSSTWEMTSCDVSQWTKWNSSGSPNADSGNWAEWRYFSANSPTADPSTIFSGQPDREDWRQDKEILYRTPDQSVGGSMDVNGVAHYTTFSNEAFGDYPIATFTNVNPYHNEAFYTGFEEYENFDINQQPNAQYNSDYAHTGARSLNTSSFDTQVNVVRDPTDYIFSAWLMTTDQGDTGLTLRSGGQTLGSKTVAPTGGKWIYAEQVVRSLPPSQAAQIEISLQHSGSGLFIDDMRFSPLDYDFSADVYDVDRRLQIASIGTNGEAMYSAYNCYDNLVARIGPGADKQVRAFSVLYNSRKGNEIFADASTFSKNNPNMSFSALAQTGGAWEGFALPSTDYFPPSNLVNMSIQNGLLVSEGTPENPASATFSRSISEANYLINAEIIPNNLQAGQEIGLSIPNVNGSTSNDIRLVLTSDQYKLYNAQTGATYKSEPISNIPRSTFMVIEVVNGNHLFVYADGRFLFDYQFTGTLSGQPEIISTNTYGYCDNFVTIVEPILSKTTYDGNQRSKQQLRRKNPDELLVQEKLYGGPLDLHTATTRLTIVDNDDIGGNSSTTSGIPMSYIENFAVYDPATLTVDPSSIVCRTYGYDNPFSFSREVEKSPRLLVTASGSGGTFSANQNGTTYQYGSTKDESLNCALESDSLIMTQVTNPDDLQDSDITNREGYKFSDVTEESGDTITWQYEYDKFMRQTKEYQPNFFPDGRDNPNFYTEKEYSFIGNQTSHRTPDAGTQKYFYDEEGRLRFMVDAVGLAVSPNIIQYKNYDDLGRLIEEGYMRRNWDEPELKRAANPDVSWIALENTPPPTFWQKRYSYNGDGLLPNIGRLTRILTNNDEDAEPEVEENLSYDIYGNIVEKTLKVSDYDSTTYRVTYQYDLLHNVTRIDDGTGEPTVFTYNNLGQIEAVGIPDNLSYYARYTYHDTSLTETLNNGSHQRIYYLNPAGWIDQIEDSLFTELLTYTHGGLGGAGYYSGLIASAASEFNWSGAPQDYTFKYKYDDFGRLIAGYISETDEYDLNYATYDDNGNITVLQRWKDKTLFWNDLLTDGNWLQTTRISEAGSVSNIHNGGNYEDAYHGLAIDPAARKIYWVDRDLSLERADFDGGNVENLQTLSHTPGGMAVDLKNRKLYWAEPDAGAMLRRDLDNDSWDCLFSGQGRPANVAVDPYKEKIYWPDIQNPPYEIKSANLDGSDIQTVIVLPAGSEPVGGFAIDTMRSKIYWSGSTTIQYANQDGTGGIGDLYTGGTDIRQISLDIFNKQVFWTDRSLAKIQQINFDGSGLSVFQAGLNKPQWLVQNLMSNIYTYKEGSNQLLGTEGQDDQYRYDENGNVIQSTVKQIDQIGYLPYIQLPQQIQQAACTISFQYGGHNQRVLKSSGESSLLYVHGLNDYPLLEKVKAAGGQESAISYVYGPTGLISINYNGEDYFVLKDHLGSVRVVIDQNNQVAAYLNYTPFGQLMSEVSQPGDGSVLPIIYRYTGQEYDREMGLYNYRARMYDPEIGRFYAVDPANQFASSYVYVGNNPILYADPTGTWSFGRVFKAIAGAGLTVVGGVVELAAVGLDVTGIGIPAGMVTHVVGFSLLVAGGELLYSAWTDDQGESIQYEINRSSWTKKGLATGRNERGEYCDELNCWQYDDRIRDDLDMNWQNLNYVTELRRGMIQTLEDGRYIYVYRGTDNKLIIRHFDRDVGGKDYSRYRYPNNYKNGRYLHVRHSQLNGGWEPLWCAGELRIKDNKIYRLNNESGHFKPEEWRLNYVKITLDAWGIPLHPEFRMGNYKDVTAAE